MRFADLDAVTIDAFGTLVELIDPVPTLRAGLLESPGAELSPERFEPRFISTLGRLGIEPARKLHVGDKEDDKRAATSAGVHFRPPPLPAAIAGLR